MDQETYKTNNLYLATALVTMGAVLIDVVQNTDSVPYRADFLFPKTKEVMDMANAYFTEKDLVSAKALFNNWRILKARAMDGRE